jgi:hypothetical protein
MNWTTIIFGTVMIAFGIATTMLGVIHPRVFWKLEPMKQRWGLRAGFCVHVLGYSIVPIAARCDPCVQRHVEGSVLG